MSTLQQSFSSSIFRGVVKQINSGDTVVIRGPAKGGPPPERTLGLSGITAPRLARRPTDNIESMELVKDEPFGWEAREYLRKKLIGKEVCFVVDQKTVGNKKEYGVLHLGKDTSCENIAESLVSEGLVEVRKGAAQQGGEYYQKLSQLEDVAKAASKGRWGPPEILHQHVRDIKWNVDNPRQFLEINKDKEIDAIIEYIRDGCTVRAILIPSFQYVTVMLTGVKTPMFKTEDGKTIAEAYAEEAKYFTEVRLLQRDVKILFESTSNQNLIGTIIHPNGNIAELLLQEGFAHCSDWSMKNVTKGVDKLRAAERIAKDKKLRLWKDFQQSNNILDVKDKTYTAKVIEVVNADGLIVKMNDGSINKIFLSSIRSPRLQDLLDLTNGTKKKKVPTATLR